MKTQKDRRKNGYVTPNATIPIYELKNKNSDIFINEFYDDWDDYRDGQRDMFNDNKLIKHIPRVYLERTEIGQIRLKMNDKIKRQIKIREAKKLRKRLL